MRITSVSLLVAAVVAPSLAAAQKQVIVPQGMQASATLSAGTHEIKVRAVNAIGQSQPAEALWNPAGYMRNVVEITRVRAA